MKKHKKNKHPTKQLVVPPMLYLCDRHACGDVCPNQDCCYTRDIEHAINFKRCGDGWVETNEYTSGVTYIQPDQNITVKTQRDIFDRLLMMKQYGIVIIPKSYNIISSESPHNNAIGF